MSKTIKSTEKCGIRFSLVEEADPLTMHTQISVYANYELQKGFEINQYEQAVHYFNTLVENVVKPGVRHG